MYRPWRGHRCDFGCGFRSGVVSHERYRSRFYTVSVAVLYPSEIVQNLREVVRVLVADPPIREIYPLVEQHVELLAAPLSFLEEARAALIPIVADDTVERALCDLLTYHLADLVPLPRSESL